MRNKHREMSVFPQSALKPEVREHLHSVYTHTEVVAEVGTEEAERAFEALLSCLSHPPMFTCVRGSTHLHPLPHIQHRLQQHLAKEMKPIFRAVSRYGIFSVLSEEVNKSIRYWPSGLQCLISWQQTGADEDRGSPAVIHTHPHLPDVLLVPVRGPRCVELLASEVVVGAQCGNAVLRGAHVFAPGVLSTPKFMKAGDVVSVFSDIEGKCTRGSKGFQGKKVFLGNGVSEVGRSEIFCSDGPARGLAVRMTDPVYQSPSFDGVLTEELFLQNLPSVVVGHVLGPRPGECVLDMCAAPGGKTTHIASLMGNQGTVVALDKIRSKVEKILQKAESLRLDCITAFCWDSTQAVRPQLTHELSAVDGPPFPEESFDRVLLDAPCSGLGQRPNMTSSLSLKEVCSYPPLQRKLLSAAVRLLKKGGVLVYSTCTVTLAENEEQVAWALRTFPCLTLDAQEPHVGSEGMCGSDLSCDQRRLLQRFRPELLWAANSHTSSPESLQRHANTDTIGFFIAKFIKR